MAINERSTIVGLFHSREEAECAVRGLTRLGLGEKDIGFAVRDQENTLQDARDKKQAEGAVQGAVAGGLLGAALGAAAALLLPGVGPIVAGGVLASTLGAAVVGAAAGGLWGTLTGMGVPEEQAHYYEEEFRKGSIVVTAWAQAFDDGARRVMRDCGAYFINSHGSATEPASMQSGQENA